MTKEVGGVEQLKESRASACQALGEVLLSYGEKLSADDFRRIAEAFNNLANTTEELVKLIEEQSKPTESVEGE